MIFLSWMIVSNSDFKDLEKLIPQREPIVLIDGLRNSGKESTTSFFTVPAEHLFVENGVLREPGLIENIAHTAAARAGYETATRGEIPKVGFIGDLSKLQIHRLPKTGTTLETTVTHLQQVFDITLVKGVIEDEEGTVVECEMKIVIRESEPS